MNQTTIWLREKISEHAYAPGRDLIVFEQLASSTRSIFRGSGMAFGQTLARFDERDKILKKAAEALQAWVPFVREAHLHLLVEIARETKLPIETAPYLGKLIATRTAALNARRAAAGKLEPRNEALEQAIAERPDDDQAYSVLADWLETQGSPRGAFIHMCLRGDDTAAYLEQYRGELVGMMSDDALAGLVWKRGYIDAAKLSSTDHSILPDLEQLLHHPSGRRLRELAIGMNGESQGFDLDAVYAVLLAEQPRALRALHLGDFLYPDETEMSWYDLADPSVLWPVLPALQKLIVQGGPLILGELHLPALEHAEFRSGGLTTECARSIANARWPKLARLDVWYGDSSYGGTSTIDDVEALLARRDLSALRHLGLMNAQDSEEICELLATSPLTSQLEVLDLSMGTLGDAGIEVLLANRRRFGKLQRIDISRSFVSDAAVEHLKTLGAWVIADEMREPCALEDRYVSVSE